jgi:hypothetical protein
MTKPALCPQRERCAQLAVCQAKCTPKPVPIAAPPAPPKEPLRWP